MNQRRQQKEQRRPRNTGISQAVGVFFLCAISFHAGSLTNRKPFQQESTALCSLDKTKFELAKQKSLGFMDDIDAREWKMLQQKAREVYPNTLGNPREGPQFPGTWFQNDYEPDFVCRHERRIGSLGDGGKWVCDPHRIAAKKDCLVYSVGSNGDASFEAAVQKHIGKHCEIHVFDFDDYAQTVTWQAPGSHYHQWGLGKTPSKRIKTLNETVRLLGHVGRTIDIFKIDCEGCEKYTFSDWFEAPVTLQQILVEVHSETGDDGARNGTMTNPQTSDMFERFYKEGYVIFHKEPNIAFWLWKKCAEYAFLKLSPDFIGVP